MFWISISIFSPSFDVWFGKIQPIKNGYLKANSVIKMESWAPKNLKPGLFPVQNSYFGRKTNPDIVML